MSEGAGQPHETRQFTLGRSLAYSAILVVAFFGVVEVLLRIVGVAPPLQPRILLRLVDTDIKLPFIQPDADVFWSPVPGFRGEFMDKPVTINSLGLRGGEVALPKPAGRKRVVCFGDSITFGYGVGDTESYPHLLGRALADKNADVVNAGVTGFTSHQVRGLVRRLLPQIQADVATICIGWNDGNRRPVDDREYDRRLRMVMAVEGPLDHVYLYRALKSAYVRSVALEGLEPKKGTSVTGRRATLPQYRENLEAIVAECRENGVKPVFIALPRRKRPGEVLPEPAYARALVEAGKALGVPVLDSGDLGLDTTLESNDAYFIDLLHLSPSGSALMAERLAQQLEALGVI
jgi:lysophospholipase L1-like esterase